MSSISRATEQRTFFALIAAATLLPYLAFPLLRGVLANRMGAEEITALLLFLGANSHVGSSFFFYQDRPMREFMLARGRMRFVLVPVSLVVAGALIFALGDEVVRAYATVAFWIWQVHHFTRQNHGIMAFTSRGVGLTPILAERTAISFTNVAGILGALVFMTPFRETFLLNWGWQIHVVGLGAYGLAAIAYLVSLTDPSRRVPSWRALTLLLLMLFYLPLYVADDAFSAVFLFLTAHGLQYLVFMFYVARKSDQGPGRAALAIVVLAVGIGYGLTMMQSGGLSTTQGLALLGAAYGVIIWHFLLDARVWRLSEPFQRGYMRQRFEFLLGSK